MAGVGGWGWQAVRIPTLCGMKGKHFSTISPSLCLFRRSFVENAIRPTALGKKNWLFIGDAGAGERGAILYTLVESCRRRGIDPMAYLREVFTRLPLLTNWQFKELTPEAWQKNHRPRKPLSEAS